MSTESEDNKKLNPDNIELEVDQGEDAPPVGCGIMGKYPVLSVLLFAAVGVGVGVGLSQWEPDDPEDKKITLKWLGLVGDMFIRALKAVVLPLVFINVTISVVEMMSLGRASSVGWLTIGLYLMTTVVAAIVGIISILSFKGLFDEGSFEEDGPATVTLGCNEPGFFIAETDAGLMCSDAAEDMDMEFVINDVTGAFVKKSGGARDDISLSDTFYNGIFTKLISSNIFNSFNTANFAAVVVFAIAFGAGLGRVLHKRKEDDFGQSPVIILFREIDGILLTLINWIIMATPFAVLSLIIRAVGNQSDLKNAFANVGWLVVATMVANLFHFLIVHVGLLALVRRENPIEYLKHIVPAQTMAFACASSAATIPMTLRCVLDTGVVPAPVARFVVPLGATINMDGGAIYFPCATIWMAILNGITPDAASYFLLIIIATVGSAGTAPVPSASLVLIITAYNTVFNTSGTPDGFEFILAIDWFMDRLRTTLNVTGDTVVTGMVAKLSHYEEEETAEGKQLDDDPSN